MRAAVSCALALVTVEGVRLKTRSTDCYSKYDGKALLQVTPAADEVAALQEAITFGQCVELNDGGLRANSVDEVVCSVAVAKKLEETFGKSARMVSMDAGGYYRGMSGTTEPFISVFGASAQDAFYTNWRGFADQAAAVEAAVSNSGGAATLETFGTTREGVSMKAVRIRGANYRSGDPKLLFTFNLHAREWLTGMSGVYAVENIVAKAKAEPDWIAGMEIVIVPMANPDGFKFSEREDRYWRKNRKPKGSRWGCPGVDLNRNFPKDYAGRGSTSTRECSDTYIGQEAASEPETKALIGLMSESPLSVHIDVHAFSQLILTAWSWTKDAHPRRAELLDLGNKMKDAMRAKTGANYAMGDNLLYQASGVMADYSTELGALGYTYELRPASGGISGFAPPTSQILPGVMETLEGLYEAIDHAKR